MLAGGEFADALDAIYAMAAIDDDMDFAVTVRRDNSSTVSRSAEPLMSKIKLFAPAEVIQRLRAAIEIRVCRPDYMRGIIDARWNENFDALKQFHDDHGHINVSHEVVTPCGVALKHWLQLQRREVDAGSWYESLRIATS